MQTSSTNHPRLLLQAGTPAIPPIWLFVSLPPQEMPTASPTPRPSNNPTHRPSQYPSSSPIKPPTNNPTKNPTMRPSHTPTKNPTISPTLRPTSPPSNTPTKNPSISPTLKPTNPTSAPSKYPTISPTYNPSASPTKNPSISPTLNPSTSPTEPPTTAIPTRYPTNNPSKFPTKAPTQNPSRNPTKSPTENPTKSPTLNPSQSPTKSPTGNPSKSPTLNPTISPTKNPTISPTLNPSKNPTVTPSKSPTISPTQNPSKSPTENPTKNPSISPTLNPSKSPTISPTQNPSRNPTQNPTKNPSVPPTPSPTKNPSISPTKYPTSSPSPKPTTAAPTEPTFPPQPPIMVVVPNQPAVPIISNFQTTAAQNIPAPAPQPQNIAAMIAPNGPSAPPQPPIMVQPPNNPSVPGYPQTVYPPQYNVYIPPPTTTTTLPPLPGHTFGAFGQNCPIPRGQEQCTKTTDFVTDQTGQNQNGEIICSARDCCMCKSISCGSPGSLDCVSLSFTGDAAAFGVKEISVYTEAQNQGAIDCTGTRSCSETKIVSHSLSRLGCSGFDGCKTAEIVINDPSPDFTLTCGAPGVSGSCQGATIIYNITGPPSGNVCDPQHVPLDVILGNIHCLGSNSCNNLKVYFVNNGCDNLIIPSLICESGACIGSAFGFYGKAAIGINQCQLPLNEPMPFGLERCYANMLEIKCSDPMGCAGVSRTITNPKDGFTIFCENLMSCANAQFTVDITAGNSASVINVICGSIQACEGLNVLVNNQRHTIQVNVQCNTDASCNGANFASTGNVNVDVSCIAPERCLGCTLNNGATCGGWPVPIGPVNIPPMFQQTQSPQYMPPQTAPQQPQFSWQQTTAGPNPGYYPQWMYSQSTQSPYVPAPNNQPPQFTYNRV